MSDKIKQEITLTEFFDTDYPSFGAYDNLRKMPSIIDGLKLSQRKVIYTMLKKFPNPSTENKTARLASYVAAETEYVHGEQSLCGVLDSMAAYFTGSNSFPLIAGHGNFGSRFQGFGSAAAPRYTYVSLAKLTTELFNKDDLVLCPSQIFEGTEIEPTFFMPILPLVFLNGSEGLSVGWRTQIYPRDPQDIIKYISQVIKGVKNPVNPNEFVPYFRGFKGVTKLMDVEGPVGVFRKEFVNFGIINKLSNTKLKITEIPIGFNHASYIKILDRLVERQTIVDYDDESDPKSDTFEFTISVKRTFFEQNSTEDEWIKTFRLSTTLNEQLNCIDRNNQVAEYTCVKDMLDDFIKIRLEYSQKRKEYLLNKYSETFKLSASRYVWCKGIIQETIKIKNKPKADIEKQLENIKHIIKHDGTYNYLFNMPITSITFEKMEELKKTMLDIKEKIATVNAQTANSITAADLTYIKTVLK